MIENNDEKDNDRNFESDTISNVTKVWIVEWHSKFERTSTEERTNYQEALEIFNEKTKEEKNTILYEVKKSISDGKILKKIPLLNSSRYTERKKNLQNDTKEALIQKNEVRKPSLKMRIIMLLIIIVALIITIYWINVIASAGTPLNSHIVFHTIINDMGITTNNFIAV
ncbi:MAG: hypothetical protein ABJB76_09445 [Candidatus Nitrosocosmicus sp.]